MTRAELHGILQNHYDELHVLLQPNAMPHISTDTAAAIGYAIGSISKAKALVGRDIDQIGEGPDER